MEVNLTSIKVILSYISVIQSSVVRKIRSLEAPHWRETHCGVFRAACCFKGAEGYWRVLEGFTSVALL